MAITTDSLREINRAISQLNEAAQQLQQEISRFTVRSESFSAPAEEQAQYALRLASV
ncbi:hypothetical protein IQ241_04400 [Romeria aff. gracilis LEGE 07310]|uniref:Uncharacterized protein n=1 Tax=Vasconcelosia minhoensis LEGE 07310 TaxID=915328 RepID=A0A8J7AVQ5_9CYAN|nr:hypothetical protein [Romeria gracilis]MBE9076542.1 hypothetical protein [Romeria aff. gracilis LEGE 07310]